MTLPSSFVLVPLSAGVVILTIGLWILARHFQTVRSSVAVSGGIQRRRVRDSFHTPAHLYFAAFCILLAGAALANAVSLLSEDRRG